jgi:hypothetical protein
MKPVKLNWALTPWLRSHNDHGGHTALVSFDCYVDKELFEIIKPEWSGYIMKNGKKTAVYNHSVIETLEEQGRHITIDGIVVCDHQDIKDLTDRLLAMSQNSTNDRISYLSNLYLQKKKWEEQALPVLKELQDMWQSFERATNSEKILGIDAKNFHWTRISAGSDVPEHDYQVDMNYGIRRGITYDEPSHEYFVPVDLYARLKDGVSLEHMRSVVSAAQTLPHKPKFNENDKWSEGYDAKTFEPKKGDWRFKNKYW